MKLSIIFFTGLLLSCDLLSQSSGASFSYGQNMNTPRMAQIQITLPDGRVAMLGGHTTGFTASNTAEIWDGNSFVQFSMNFVHDGGACVRLLNGKYLLAGSADDLGIAPGFNTAEIFDPNTDSFTPTANFMNYPRCNTEGATLTNGNVLLAGGWYDVNSSTYGEVYDAISGTFSLTGALNTPRASCIVLPASDGGAMVFGGSPAYGGNGVEMVEYYDTVSNTFSVFQNNLFPADQGWWTYASSFFRPMESQILSNGKYMLLALKYNGTDYDYLLYTFDPSSKQFEKFNTTPALPSSQTAYVYSPVVDNANGLVYLLAQDPDSVPVQAQLYTVNLDDSSLTIPSAYYQLSVNHFPIAFNSTLLQDGRIMITGGSENNTITQNFYPVAYTIFADPDYLTGEENTDRTGIIKRIRIFPNPSSDYLFIENVSSEDAALKLELYNLLGQKVMSKSFEVITGETAARHFLPVRSLPSGIYSLVFRSSSDLQISKVSITH